MQINKHNKAGRQKQRQKPPFIVIHAKKFLGSL
jgi:hypothetical protein